MVLLRLGSNQPDPATGTLKRLNVSVAGAGWLEPKRDKAIGLIYYGKEALVLAAVTWLGLAG